MLDKVDGVNQPAYRPVIDRWWATLKATKPEPAIFWQFIEDERNDILKEHRRSAGPGATVQLSGMEIGLDGQSGQIDPPNPTTYHYLINSGPFEGRDQRDLVREAIDWWERELDEIDAEVRSTAR